MDAALGVPPYDKVIFINDLYNKSRLTISTLPCGFGKTFVASGGAGDILPRKPFPPFE
jgi:hypothetical protein